MGQELDSLVQEVSQTKDVQASAVALLNGLSARISDIQAKLADQGVVNRQLDDLAKELDASSNDLASAITANTPADTTGGGGTTDTGGGGTTDTGGGGTTDTGGGGTTDTGGGGTTDAGGGV